MEPAQQQPPTTPRVPWAAFGAPPVAAAAAAATPGPTPPWAMAATRQAGAVMLRSASLTGNGKTTSVVPVPAISTLNAPTASPVQSARMPLMTGTGLANGQPTGSPCPSPASKACASSPRASPRAVNPTVAAPRPSPTKSTEHWNASWNATAAAVKAIVGTPVGTPGASLAFPTPGGMTQMSPQLSSLSLGKCERDNGSAPPSVDGTTTTTNGESIEGLRNEIGDLRSEVEALRGILSKAFDPGLSTEGSPQRTNSTANRRTRGSASPPAGPIPVQVDPSCSAGAYRRIEHQNKARMGELQRQREMAEAQLKEARAEALRLRAELKGKEKAQPVLRRGRLSTGTEAVNEVSVPPTRSPQPSASPRRRESSPASPELLRSMSRSSSCHAVARSPSPVSQAQRAEDIDEMWCAVLRRFPQYPHWTLLKEKNGVYRMGSPIGKKIVCQIYHGTLQVRVGGGWMGAVPFLEMYGIAAMGAAPSGGLAEERPDAPAAMDRLLVPTKCWTQRIATAKPQDAREQRRHPSPPRG